MKITELFERGEFVVSAEVGPPKGFHVEHLLEEAKTYLGGIGDGGSHLLSCRILPAFPDT